MRKIKLPNHIVSQLLKLPETGMGYQKVKLTFKNGKILKNMTVLNSEFLIENGQEINVDNIEKVEI